MPPLGAIGIALAAIGAAASVGGTIASAVKGGGGGEEKRPPPLPGQISAADELSQKFNFSKMGQGLQGASNLGGALSPDASRFRLTNPLNPPNTNRFGFGDPAKRLSDSFYKV